MCQKCCGASWPFCARTQNNDQKQNFDQSLIKIIAKETFTKFKKLDNMTKIRNVEESHC